MEDEVVRFKLPSQDRVKVTMVWFVRVGRVSQDTIVEAMKQASKDGKRNDLPWDEALHRIVNEAVRKNKNGWKNYEGDWVKLKKAWSEYGV